MFAIHKKTKRQIIVDKILRRKKGMSHISPQVMKEEKKGMSHISPQVMKEEKGNEPH
jgi:hypothetical protein